MHTPDTVLWLQPEKQIKNFKSYKGLKTLIMDQCPKKDIKIKLYDFIYNSIAFYFVFSE